MAKNKESILAVDDSSSILKIVHGLLKNTYNMHLAKSGRMALSVLEHMSPGLILLDIEMPEMSGFIVMETILHDDRLRRIPVFFVTAHSSKDFVMMARRQGAKDYLVKPINPELLKAKINNILKDIMPYDSKKRPVHSFALYDEYDLENDMKVLYLKNKKKAFSIHMKIIGDLLDYAETESVKSDLIPTYFDMNEFFNSINAVNRRAAESRGFIFQSDYDRNLPRIIFGDEIRLSQIINGILNNIIHYSNGGYIRFSIDFVTGENDAENIAFNVESSELGVIEHDFAIIYGKFEQMGSQQKNKGIINARPRLPIARRLAEIINGDIYFTHSRDKGSAVTVELLFQAGESRSGAQRKEPAKLVTVKPDARILVVDDNPVNLKIAAVMLSKHGVTPETARSGKEAVKLIQEKRFDLVFMDHLMPEMDGAETSKMIRALGGEYYAEIPIIALSAYNAAKARELFLRSGMNDFITKPIDGAELNMALQNWLPADKLTDNRQNAAQSDAGDEAELNDLINQIGLAGSQELSVVKGLKSTGGDKKLYIEILAHFCSWIDNDMRLVNEAMQHKRWKDYTIRMHALKTLFANIGDELMSDWAASLETAAAEGDIDKCIKETEHFHNNVNKLHSRLAGVFKREAPEARLKKNEISADVLNEVLQKLSEACMTCFADRCADFALKLKEAVFGGEIDDMISEICDYIDSYDFDKAYNACQTVLGKLIVKV